MQPKNPYITGDPVGTSSVFTGRENIMREVLKVLRSPNQNAITLFGQRRVGKTSMLQYLQARLPSEGGFQTVYFDLQDKAEWSLTRILIGLANTILDKLNLPVANPVIENGDAFIDWLAGILNSLPAGTSLVLLFDEFDVLADSKSGLAAADFFLYLHKLLILDPIRLKFILVLGRNFSDLGSIALSAFKGIPSRRISLLNKADTIKLVRLSEQDKTLSWPSKAVEMVWGLTHGHPYLTQALCSQVWEAAYDETPETTPIVTPEMVEAAVDSALDTSRNTLEWLWNGLGPAEKVISAALSGAGNQVVDEIHLEQLLRESGVRILIRELQNAPELLKSWDILEPVAGGYIFRVEILRRWIERYHSLKRTQDELDRIQPAADSLYQAALAFYAQGNLKEAENLLKQAIGVNPNHLRANELLAEILIGLGRLDDAREKLELLFALVPNTVRPRLIQIYLDQAQAAPDDKARLALYQKVLALDESRPEAIAGVERIKQLEEEERVVFSDFLEGRQALQRGEWDKAIELMRKVVMKRPSYVFEADSAAGLLDKAVREKEQPLASWKVSLRRTQTWVFLGFTLFLVLAVFSGTFGIKAFQTCVDARLGVCGTLAPTYSPTPLPPAVATLTPSSTPTPPPTDTPTVVPTLPPSPITPGTTRMRRDGMTTIYIPGDTFNMGYEHGDSYEKPVHEVKLDPFWMDRTEVTNEMFVLFLNSIKEFAIRKNYDKKIYYENELIYYLPNDNGIWDRIIWNGSQFSLKSDVYKNHPVVNMTWQGAFEYCEWAGAHLPTEAQWEYVARGTDERQFPWGNNEDCQKVNATGPKCDGQPDTAPIGIYIDGANDGRSPFGIFDMAGNVSEWVYDWYGDGYYNRPQLINPLGPEQGNQKIVRGGSWQSTLYDVRTSSRGFRNPGEYGLAYGFRCASSH